MFISQYVWQIDQRVCPGLSGFAPNSALASPTDGARTASRLSATVPAAFPASPELHLEDPP